MVIETSDSNKALKYCFKTFEIDGFNNKRMDINYIEMSFVQPCAGLNECHKTLFWHIVDI